VGDVDASVDVVAVPAAGADDAGIALAGSVESAPMSSSTTAAFANGSCAAEDVFGCVGAIEWTSETTGTT
jgi:hypothetical protein